MIKCIALKIGSYLHDHWCKHCTLRILIILTSIIALTYEIILSVFYANKYSDYRIYEDHFLVRKPEVSFRGISHLETECCQYFNHLSADDVETINGKNPISDAMVFLLIFIGSTVFSIWGNLLTLKGRYGLHATVTVSGILAGQFSLMKTVVKYG